MLSTELSNDTVTAIQTLISDHGLPERYEISVKNFFAPIASQIQQKRVKSGPIKLGIQGSQGSGKSTAAEFIAALLEIEHGLTVAVCSIDDFYLTRAERQTLAKTVHPLLSTRGVPGTHDTSLIANTFNQFDAGLSFELPVFEKQYDDRAATKDWPVVAQSADVLIFEGWCVGLSSQPQEALITSCNSLEETEDADLVWRNFINHKLTNEYERLFARLDLMITLQAPSFSCVFEWRRQQEEQLIERNANVGGNTLQTFNTDQLSRFIAHFQRLTEWGLKTMPLKADFTLMLSSDHDITHLDTKPAETP